MSRGVVTIATGSMRYYKMARTLVHSLRLTNPTLKVAVVTDAANPYTSEFDDVVILEKPNKSYLDKLDLLVQCPYDENIFIDADSIVYGDIGLYFDEFQSGTDFSCFGNCLPLDSDKGGYFTARGVGKWKDRIHYITNLHGGLYYIRRGEFCRKLHSICMEIRDHYSEYEFVIFKKPADEPILALACAIMNCTILEKLHDICFLPVVDSRSIRIGKNVRYTEKGIEYEAPILHFSNHNTERAFYKIERDKVEWRLRNTTQVPLGIVIRYWRYLWQDNFGTVQRAKCTIYEHAPEILKKTWHLMK